MTNNPGPYDHQQSGPDGWSDQPASPYGSSGWQSANQPQYGPPAYPVPPASQTGGPPGYQLPVGGPPVGYPPTPPRKKRIGLIILGVVGALAVVCCGIGAIAVATSPDKTTINQPALGGPSNAPQAAATTAAAAAPTRAAPPPAPKTLYGPLTGSGIKKSATFTTPAEWTFQYTYDCSNFGSKGNFQVMEYDAAGHLSDILVNELDKAGQDSVPQHADAGGHYLEINSECKWTVTVVG